MDLVGHTIKLALENVEDAEASVCGRQTISLFRLLWT